MRSYVVPVDFSKSSNLALDYAIARARRRNAKLVLVHVLASGSMAAATSEDSGSAELIIKAQEFARENARNAMHKLVARKGLSPKEHQVVFIERLDAAGAIADQARKSRARMIIMGSEGRTGLHRLFSGSVAEATLRVTRHPVLIVKKSKFIKAPAKKILVPVDFSKVSEVALKSAKEIAKAEKESLVLVNVATDTDRLVPFYLRQEYQQGLFEESQARVKKLAQRLGIGPRRYELSFIRAPDAAVAIAKEAKKFRVSMIVMGSHGRTGLKQLVLGSVAAKTLRYASCPVLVLKK
jgi:nucleotide-binding universal stress UspA family protein